MSTTPKEPADHKPKKDGQFTFTTTEVVDGKKKVKTHTLQNAGPLALKVPGGVSMDAILEPENETAQLRLGLAMLMVTDVPKDTMAALRSMPSDEMMTILLRWLNHGQVDNVSLPESSGSSD